MEEFAGRARAGRGVAVAGHDDAPCRAPELLAPAGGPDALRAAVAAGADAVYLGLGELNARAADAGFSPRELGRACALAHARGVRVYVALNALVRDGELDGAVALARTACARGADALIVADAGLCRLLRQAVPGVELHLSTQAGVQGPAAALLARRELGVARVTCARELSLGELAGLCRAGVPVEAFCHGAICICYSGACGFSALACGRSANRGDCTQPCRIPHALVDGEGRVLAGGPGAPAGDRLLCPRDCCSIRHVSDLVAAGVASLKIEGRMKNPDYVFNVVRCYRRALDAALAGRPLADGELDELEAMLARSFNRGLTDAYLRGRSGAELMSLERSINQGLRVGRVVERRHQEAVVSIDRAVAAGDTLEIRSTPGAGAAPDVPKRWPMVPCPSDAAAGEVLAVPCKRKVEAGSAVHAVRSRRVLDEAARAVAAMKAEEEDLAAGRRDRLDDDAPADRGDDPKYAPDSGDGVLDGPAGRGVPGTPSVEARGVVETPGEARLLLAASPAPEVRVPAYALLEDEGAWGPLLPRLTVVLDEVDRAADAPRVRALCARAAAVVCRNLGQVDSARAAGVPWEAAAPINVWNAGTARWLHGMGARRVWLPDELSDDEASAIARALAGTVPLGRGLTGDPQLMVCEHCLLTAEGPCAGEGDPSACTSCSRRLASLRGERLLRESDGALLPVRVDALGRTRIAAPAVTRTPSHVPSDVTVRTPGT